MPGYALQVEPQRAVTEPLWRALVAASAPASVRELHMACRAHPNAIQFRLRIWTQAGIVQAIDGSPKKFMLNPDHRPEHVGAAEGPPRIRLDGSPATPRGGRARMWHAMRILRRFDLPTLQMTAEVTRRSAEDYVNYLLRAGLIERARRGNSRTREWSIYALVGAPGPLPPRVAHGMGPDGRWRHVIDRNTGRAIDISPRRTAPFFDPEG